MLTRRTALATLAALPVAGGVAAQGRLSLRAVQADGLRIEYLVRHAVPSASPARAPMLLCFGGGDANRGIAEYYDAVYTPETVYRDHHVILPIGGAGGLFYRFDDARARAFLRALIAAEPIAGRGLISGVSNGGRAAFRFAAAAPEAFRGFITMPGAMVEDRVPDAWHDYSVLLAVGTEDPRWQPETDRAYAALQGRVRAVERVALAGQGHVVGPDFDVDPVYARLRGLEDITP